MGGLNGTGYNAALLCHRLGDQGVHTIDIDNPWHTIEAAHQTWVQLGQPQPSALGLTVTPDEQHVWCQHPDSDWFHPLIW